MPRAVLARLVGTRDQLEQLAVLTDQALAASPLLADPTTALVAPIALDRVLDDRADANAGDEPAGGAGDAPSSAAIAGARPRARSTARTSGASATTSTRSPLRSTMPPAPRDEISGGPGG
ncbi:MAG TPA: hypothetical protein VGD80_44435, partial [Kofleriaceae bacterium]